MQFVEAISGGRWLVRVIRAGLSGNNNFYPAEMLREALGLFDGARVFNKADAEHLGSDLAGKSFDKLIGSLSDPKFVESGAGEVQATLTLIQPEGEVAVKLREAFDRGLAHLFGFSINAVGKARSELREGRKVRVATSIQKVNSVDLIVEPGAGGELIRLIEAQDPHQEKEAMLRDKLLLKIKEAAPKVYATIDVASITDDELEAKFAEALNDVAQREAAKAEAAIAAANVAAGHQAAAKDAVDGDLNTELREALAAVQTAQAKTEAASLIATCGLPQQAKDELVSRFSEAKAPFTGEDVKAEIGKMRRFLAKFTEAGKPIIPFDSLSVEDRSVKMGDMLDAFFDPAHKDHGHVRSFKECYVEMTGDRYVTGLLRDCDATRMRESFGAEFREAVSSGTFANALGNSITRRMQAVFEGLTDLQAWRKVATAVPISDFRTQERVRIGGYGNLPIVAENGPYTAATSPGDAKATYAARKRGFLETISREAIKNDDIGALRRMPAELALAAANTLHEFVFDFFRTNPAIYDTVALYHATHANLFTVALSAAEFATHRLAMVKQARAGSAKRMGVSPASILVPFELQETAYNLFVRNQNLDKTYVQSINPEVIPVGYWTDANDWVTVASPSVLPVLEIGFIDGREQPELFVQDMPNVGNLFSNDQLTYKIRHEYDGAILVDGEKGTTKAVVP